MHDGRCIKQTPVELNSAPIVLKHESLSKTPGRMYSIYALRRLTFH